MAYTKGPYPEWLPPRRNSEVCTEFWRMMSADPVWFCRWDKWRDYLATNGPRDWREG